MTIGLVIFDCDGVLVDSEPIANRILADLLTTEGYRVTAAECETRFTGLRFRTVYAMVEAELGRALPLDFRQTVHGSILDAFQAELRPLSGAAEFAAGLSSSPKCVASSSSPDWIRQALTVTGLLPLFDPHLFSAVMVEHGKPHPDLFLHAAAEMGVPPEACLVIEDSVAGVTAACAARMRVIGFTGGGHARGRAYRERLAAAGAATIVESFDAVAAEVRALAVVS